VRILGTPASGRRAAAPVRIDTGARVGYERLVRPPQMQLPLGQPSSRPSSGRGELRIDVLLGEEERLAMLRAEARRGLTRTPKQLPPKWFYDERGSALFDEITRLPEYYLTRAEREILVSRADEIADITRATSLVELGSGTSEKTRLLLDALLARGTL